MGKLLFMVLALILILALSTACGEAAQPAEEDSGATTVQGYPGTHGDTAGSGSGNRGTCPADYKRGATDQYFGANGNDGGGGRRAETGGGHPGAGRSG